MENDLGAGAVEWLGVQYKTILATEDSGGGISIVDSVSPAASGPPRHIHHDADEIFVVLSGRVEFWLEGETFVRERGETAFVPRGKEHAFHVLGEEASRHLVILTPGGFEGFFTEMAERQCKIPDDLPAIAEAGQRFSMELTGPPLRSE